MKLKFWEKAIDLDTRIRQVRAELARAKRLPESDFTIVGTLPTQIQHGVIKVSWDKS